MNPRPPRLEGTRLMNIRSFFMAASAARKESPELMQLRAQLDAADRSQAQLQAQLVAIDKVQAVVELQLDGTVITANASFLRTMGYELAEVQGQQDSLFVDPAHRSSGEYRKLWEKLQRGEFDADQYKRLAKGGREVWLQGSYNP